MGSLVKDSAKALVADVKLRGSVIGVGLATFWVVHVVNMLAFLGGLNAYGIVPRSIDGLWGILFAPFLHGSFGHLIGNSIAWLWLGLLVMLRRPRDIVPVTLIGGFVSGLGTWLTGAPGTVHIGFSGVLFAYLGYLFTRGLFERNIGSIAVSALSLFFFGSMIWGILPGALGISWQGHLFGFVGGVLAARLIKTPAAPKAKRKR
jgi:membrane associated rhomboid family serine protease